MPSHIERYGAHNVERVAELDLDDCADHNWDACYNDRDGPKLDRFGLDLIGLGELSTDRQGGFEVSFKLPRCYKAHLLQVVVADSKLEHERGRRDREAIRALDRCIDAHHVLCILS